MQAPQKRIVKGAERGRSLIYLDVSGSLSELAGSLLGLLKEPVTKGQAEVYGFSTKVFPLPLPQIQKGLYDSTGGTNINCVFAHYFENRGKCKSLLILTDGMVGKIDEWFHKKIKEEGIKVYVGYVGGYKEYGYLERIAAYSLDID